MTKHLLLAVPILCYTMVSCVSIYQPDQAGLIKPSKECHIGAEWNCGSGNSGISFLFKGDFETDTIRIYKNSVLLIENILDKNRLLNETINSYNLDSLVETRDILELQINDGELNRMKYSLDFCFISIIANGKNFKVKKSRTMLFGAQ